MENNRQPREDRKTISRRIATRMRRAKKRAKYHELQLKKYLCRFGWRKGHRFAVSGPRLGIPDIFAVKETKNGYHFALFQVKPRSTKSYCYFERKQLQSLYIFEALLKSIYHPDIIHVHKVLAGRLRRKWIFHEVTDDDMRLLHKHWQKYHNTRPDYEPLFRLNRNSKSTFNPALN